MADLHVIFDYLSGQAVWWGLLLLTLSAALEYIVPPFPGDTVTVVGAVLIPTANWPLAGVFAAVTLGSVGGAAFDWWVGSWIAKNKEKNTWLHRFLDRDKIRPKVDKLIHQFEKHGSIYIALNRFLPAFRALFFVAAGLARLVLWRVLFFAALSAALWNGLLLGLGYMVGYKIDALADWVDRYTYAVYVGLAIALFVWFAIKIVRKVMTRE